MLCQGLNITLLRYNLAQKESKMSFFEAIVVCKLSVCLQYTVGSIVIWEIVYIQNLILALISDLVVICD